LICSSSTIPAIVQPLAKNRQEGTQRPSVPITLSDRDWSAPVRTLPSFGIVAGPPLLCQEAGRIAWMSAIRI
jgi:hypothetical protein